jgi:hypothetical protein
MENKFPVLNAILTIQNVVAILLIVIGVPIMLVGLSDYNSYGFDWSKIVAGLVISVIGLLFRLGVEIVRVFLEIDKNQEEIDWLRIQFTTTMEHLKSTIQLMSQRNYIEVSEILKDKE